MLPLCSLKVTGHGKGAYYPKGGGSVLVRAMVNAVLNSGRATVMVKAPVRLRKNLLFAPVSYPELSLFMFIYLMPQFNP